MHIQNPNHALYAATNDALMGLPVRTKAPRVRAFSPKVRTGCITWYVAKCDEEKPTCRRCRESQVKCDGYAPVPVSQKKPASQKQTAAKKRAIKQTQEMVQHVASQSQPRFIIQGNRLNFDIDGGVYDRMFFHHFRAITIVDFVHVINPRDFWSQRVLPMCYNDPAVRNTVVALGAAHYLYLQKLQSSNSGDTNASMSHFECVAIQYYNNAIAELVKLNNGDKSTWDTQLKTLTCCLLFICLENILGRSEEGIRHIQAGARLLKNSDFSIAPQNLQQLMQEIATVLLHFFVDVAYLEEEHNIPNMVPYALPTTEIGDGLEPFSSLQEAKDTIWDLDVKMAYVGSGKPDSDEAPDPECCMLDVAPFIEPFKRWKIKFNNLISSQIDSPNVPIDVQRETVNLMLRRCMWDIMLLPEGKNSDEELAKLNHELVDLVELLYSIEASSIGRPIFVLEGDTIPALYFSGLFSEDPVFVQRITTLLRESPRREGLWDSRQTADKLSAEFRSLAACPSKNCSLKACPFYKRYIIYFTLTSSR
ncbi:hypothetical protein COCC4DRAFT_64454 [Bipolaris maydis ATCC 48331]|uniref:Zn(2)-C6 fungal-type domain-containing protein n=2 Tax=Cochliobolus heterostrophus TaxID=5016 RepID=M2V3N7_COCH5|nr:uncharacterized protein COCC4DRAFT_64454 [Bipolaris maydis ATCC 48331]EMD94622.1 hypothetical protein COCHEDRAFT_1152500 [Bipolaris maydis C5]KAJ5029058.1 hypothetical protein J3E73DRAFT_388561 [Bipolaris maydis]ENI01665.1 hypothetical protein COCC4DRAFT_64454 [Bipolaris maydis ATCC 48331]KAJ6215197.1 hypothetical protein PSV09DRAFT_1152500 [Bipolaris maydis]KAJ6276323.1 hypothetical protein PSV08DRAFT_367744 [Bipolaris maydis]